jgi:hypothetical protein
MDDEKSCTDECCEDREIEARPLPGLSIGTPNLGPVNISGGNNRINDLVIKQMDLGYLVKVGCQTLCLETKERLIQLFTDYVNDPAKTMDKFYKNELLNSDKDE